MIPKQMIRVRAPVRIILIHLVSDKPLRLIHRYKVGSFSIAHVAHHLMHAIALFDCSCHCQLSCKIHMKTKGRFMTCPCLSFNWKPSFRFRSTKALPYIWKTCWELPIVKAWNNRPFIWRSDGAIGQHCLVLEKRGIRDCSLKMTSGICNYTFRIWYVEIVICHCC